MNRDLLQVRDAILKRNDSLLESCPERTGSVFIHEMRSVIRDLEHIAHEVDAENGDFLERSRNWRYLGNAYFDLGRGKESKPLKQAAEAFQTAEELLQGISNPIEQIKLNYSYGQTLLGLSEGRDLATVKEARRRFRTVLKLAEKEMPEAVEMAGKALAEADQVMVLLQKGEQLSEQIDDLKQQLGQTPPAVEQEHQQNQGDPMVQNLFGILKEQFDQEKSEGKLDSARQNGLESLMERLEGLVEKVGSGQSLQDMIGDRGKLDELMAEMLNKVKKPTFADQPVSTETRAARVLAHIQNAKTYIGAEGLRKGKSAGETDKAIDLYQRLARLTTAINQAGDDKESLVSLEQDQARTLLNEVRLHARGNHLTLARPIWSNRGIPQDPNLVYFRGPDQVREVVRGFVETAGMELGAPIYQGAEGAVDRWHDLCAATLSVFDLSAGDPEVYYELGIALALGTQLLLLVREGVAIPFDVAQDIVCYRDQGHLGSILEPELDAALYGIQTKSSTGSSLKATYEFAERLLESRQDDAHFRILLGQAKDVVSDPVKFRAAVGVLNGQLEPENYVLLNPRWHGGYPELDHPRCFIIMPFLEELDEVRDTIIEKCRQAAIRPIRGDVAEGQEIIQSIWEEIGKASLVIVDLTGLNLNVCLELGITDTLGRPTLLIGQQGTEQQLFPAIAKRRCHSYAASPSADGNFQKNLQDFLGTQGAGSDDGSRETEQEHRSADEIGHEDKASEAVEGARATSETSPWQTLGKELFKIGVASLQAYLDKKSKEAATNRPSESRDPQESLSGTLPAGDDLADQQSIDHNFRYVGEVEGAKGVVDVHVRRIQDQYQNVFRIDGVLRTPAGQWRFEADGHSGYGKLHDETIIYLDINEQNLAITINPYDQPAPTYYFRRA